eukprot:TRINITY_DN9160_c0_g1_i8.p1 TRINITY_DN9160_c0_g1~~TRINITY_DN9160_c0_g1_i8.p1  ORF type:complete len:316 (+),score=35.13 TRINITY_DN9160_c0_g1_i8:41-949(+)
MASILDKTMESVFGYISVLPGAFSAYRFKCLLGQPLEMYFKNLSIELKDHEPFTANMYLAEDRILCYELVAKKNCNYILKYVRQAKARTDVPTTLTDLIKQRRRWINGSLFALVYALIGWPRLLFYSGHSLLRKVMFTLQFVYYCTQMGMQWTAVSHIYLLFQFLVQDNLARGWADFFQFVFLVFLILQLVMGLGNKPKRVSSMYVISSVTFGFFTVTTFAILIPLAISGTFETVAICSIVVTFGCFVVLSILYSSWVAFISSVLPYIFFIPTYSIIFPMYSLCNTHDISWGTKNCGDESFP